MSFSSRASAVLVALALFSSHASLCAAWMAAPEAAQECPMHERDAGRDSSLPGPSAPDGSAPCCAMSGRSDAAPTQASFALIHPAAPVETPVLPFAPPPVTGDPGRVFAPPPVGHVARHLLLTVLLV